MVYYEGMQGHSGCMRYIYLDCYTDQVQLTVTSTGAGDGDGVGGILS